MARWPARDGRYFVRFPGGDFGVAIISGPRQAASKSSSIEKALRNVEEAIERMRRAASDRAAA